jgi:hypothetical protein
VPKHIQLSRHSDVLIWGNGAAQSRECRDPGLINDDRLRTSELELNRRDAMPEDAIESLEGLHHTVIIRIALAAPGESVSQTSFHQVQAGARRIEVVKQVGLAKSLWRRLHQRRRLHHEHRRPLTDLDQLERRGSLQPCWPSTVHGAASFASEANNLLTPVDQDVEQVAQQSAVDPCSASVRACDANGVRDQG